MTINQFRQMALALPDVEERAHFGHPDFRVRGKIFATLGYPDKAHGALMLSPEQQKDLLQAAPLAFSPAAGAWGTAGSTIVRLRIAEVEVVGEAMTLAWQKASSSPSKTSRKTGQKRRATSRSAESQERP